MTTYFIASPMPTDGATSTYAFTGEYPTQKAAQEEIDRRTAEWNLD